MPAAATHACMHALMAIAAPLHVKMQQCRRFCCARGVALAAHGIHNGDSISFRFIYVSFFFYLLNVNWKMLFKFPPCDRWCPWGKWMNEVVASGSHRSWTMFNACIDSVFAIWKHTSCHFIGKAILLPTVLFGIEQYLYSFRCLPSSSAMVSEHINKLHLIIKWGVCLQRQCYKDKRTSHIYRVYY